MPSGAPPGNRRARKHGRYTREKRANISEARALIREISLFLGAPRRLRGMVRQRPGVTLSANEKSH